MAGLRFIFGDFLEPLPLFTPGIPLDVAGRGGDTLTFFGRDFFVEVLPSPCGSNGADLDINEEESLVFGRARFAPVDEDECLIRERDDSLVLGRSLLLLLPFFPPLLPLCDDPFASSLSSV